ncbi:MAG: IS4 family transposase [Bacteroidaceae bacterium]|nr:IS4 family transposase [Bacteroidaceae bacterium]
MLINKVRPMYAKERVPDVYLPGWEIFAIDSTTIPCSIKLAEWALGKRSKGGVKMHTVLDLRGSIPDTIYVTDSRWHDSNFLDVYEPYKWAIYTMDKAYVDFEALYRMHQSETYFVTRAKDTMRYEVVSTNYNIDALDGIDGDQVIHLSGYISEKKYPQDLRLVKFYDAEKDEVISFITNIFELGPRVIANIYRNRWQIETFFKWIKGNLTIKSLWGYSENAVKIHLWVAISAYLLLAWVKAALKSPLTITEVSKVIEASILSKADIRELLDVQEPLTQNQNDNELLLNF